MVEQSPAPAGSAIATPPDINNQQFSAVRVGLETLRLPASRDVNKDKFEGLLQTLSEHNLTKKRRNSLATEFTNQLKSLLHGDDKNALVPLTKEAVKLITTILAVAGDKLLQSRDFRQFIREVLDTGRAEAAGFPPPFKSGLMTAVSLAGAALGTFASAAVLTGISATGWGLGNAVSIASTLLMVGGSVALGVWSYRNNRAGRVPFDRAYPLLKQLVDLSMAETSLGPQMLRWTLELGCRGANISQGERQSFWEGLITQVARRQSDDLLLSPEAFSHLDGLYVDTVRKVNAQGEGSHLKNLRDALEKILSKAVTLKALADKTR